VAGLVAISFLACAICQSHPHSPQSLPSIHSAQSVPYASRRGVDQGQLTLSLFPAPSLTSGKIVPVSQFNLLKNNVRLASFTTLSDLSSLNTYYQIDGLAKSYEQSFYPPQEGEICLRPKSLVIYDADGVDVHSEEWYRLSGRRDRIGHRLQDGSYLSFTLFADGQTAATETLVGPPDPFSNNFARKLVSKLRWYERNHVLAYRSVLLDDGTREVDTFDENALPMMEKHLGRRGVFGTTIKLFYPGTRQTLLESQTSIRATKVVFRRPNGSVRLTERLSPDEIDVTYFDERGITPLFEQSWFLVGAQEASRSADEALSTEEDEAAPKERKPILHLWKITELNPDGSAKRILAFRDGILRTETWINITVDGIIYASAVINYSSDGTVLSTELDTGANSGTNSGMKSGMEYAKKQAKKKIDRLPSLELVRLVSAEELVEPDLHYALPIPPSHAQMAKTISGGCGRSIFMISAPSSVNVADS
jgi:hypothetical protein